MFTRGEEKKMSGTARTKRWVSRGLCVVVLFESLTWAAESAPSSQIDAAEVRALLARLESNQAAERSAAVKELQALGPVVLPHLPPPDRMESPAAREIVIHLRNTLERELARKSAQPSTVTLRRAADRADLSAELSRQTGNALAVSESVAKSSMNVDWQQVPFWAAVNDLLNREQERVTWNSAMGRFQIEPRPTGSASTIAHSGVFRVEAIVGKLKPATDETQSVMRVNTIWQVEPRLRPLFLRIKTAEWRGTFGDRAVSPWNPEAEYELPFADGTRQLSWPLDLVWPPMTNQKKWSLEGRAAVHLAAMTETITFDAVALRPNVQRRRGSVVVRVRKVDFRPADNDRLDATIRIQVSYDTGGPAFESHRAGVFYQGASLIGPDGNRIVFTDYDATQEADGAVGAEYRFHNLPGRSSDYRFAYEAPTLFLDVPVDVDFHGLPLPE